MMIIIIIIIIIIITRNKSMGLGIYAAERKLYTFFPELLAQYY